MGITGLWLFFREAAGDPLGLEGRGFRERSEDTMQP